LGDNDSKMDTDESKKKKQSAAYRLLKAYVKLLHEKPVITKSCTSATLGAAGSLISQLLTRAPGASLQWKGIYSYAATGLVFTGPSVHFFHLWLEKTFPKGVPYSALKKLLIDRVTFCPAYLWCYLFLLAIFEGNSVQMAMSKISIAYMPALLINLKVWTPLQYLNVKYIPQQYRSAFMGIMALLWTVFIAYKRGH